MNFNLATKLLNVNTGLRYLRLLLLSKLYFQNELEMSQTKNDKDFKMTKEVRLTLFLEASLKYRGCFRVFALRFVISTADYSNSLIS